MAGKKIRGITVEIGGDVSGLNKALDKSNSKIRDTQKQLKDVERLLKLDPGNVELLRQKQVLLTEAVSATTGKLEELQKAQDALKASGVDENSAQYMALQREIIATEGELRDLKSAAEDTESAMDRIGQAAERIASGAQAVADKTAGLSRAAGAGLKKIYDLGMQAVAASDDLNTLSKQSGLTTHDLQALQYAASLIDVDTGAVIGAMGKLKKNMASTSASTAEAFAQLGVSTRSANGELRDVSDVFFDTIEALSRIPNETERDVVAMNLFGRSADQLAGLVDDGGEAFRGLMADAEQLGIILDQETLDGLNDVNDELDKLKMQAAGVMATSGAKAVEAFTPIIEDVVGVLGDLLDRLGQMSPAQIRVLTTVLAVVAAISPVAGTVAKVSGAVSNVTQMMTNLGPVLTTVRTGLSGLFSTVTGFVAANPIVLIIAAIVALVALIAVKGDEIQAILQRVDDFLQGVFATDWTEVFGPVLGGILNGFFATVKNVWDSVKQVFDGVIDFIRGVFTGDWQRAWTGVKEIFAGIFGMLESVAKAPINAIIGLINGAINGINMMISALNGLSFSIPDWVPVLGGKSFGLHLAQLGSIPYLASGGILSRGSAVVGEAGPELLTMAGGRAVVTPLTGGAALGGVESLLQQLVGQQGAGVPQTIVVQSVLDGRVIGETAWRYSEQRARSRG